MKIKEIGNPNITIQEYLRLNDIKDVDVYLNPTDDMFEDVENYDGMKKGYDMLREQLGTHVSFMLIDEMEEGDNN